MKTLVLALAVSLSFASASVAGTVSGSGNTSSATATARELANALMLNELQYLKLKGFENTRLAEVKAAQATLAGTELATGLAKIEAKFNASVLSVLTPAQQKSFLIMTGTTTAVAVK